MAKKKKSKEQAASKQYTVLVAVDFSQGSAYALRRAKSIMGQKPDRILVLHVIDHDFIEKCQDNKIGPEEEIKKALFLQAKKRLKDFLKEEDIVEAKVIVTKGIPFLEINRVAVEEKVDMVVMGNRGTSGDMKTIFFGSTTERVLRFMKRPVLCTPIEEERN